ncbi:hypothetical protein Pan258_51460 [Symmachiella dynata]|nr:hypothetical protein Pan258_51460 [Symmachiella dynata]
MQCSGNSSAWGNKNAPAEPGLVMGVLRRALDVHAILR